jgi:hypothetical protein
LSRILGFANGDVNAGNFSPLARLEQGQRVLLSEDLMSLRRSTMYENTRSALECDSEAAAVKFRRKGGS